MDQNTNQGTPTGVEGQAPEPQAPAAPEPVVPQPAPAQTVAPTAQPTEQDARTKEQFDKLLESNRRLFEANELLQQDMARRSQVNQTFAPVQQQPQVNPDDFMDVDPTTGEKYANAEKLQAKINDLNARATRAEQSVQNYIRQTEEKESGRQNEETFKAYPELNPANQVTGKFDVEFHKQTRALIYDSLINPMDYNGRPLEFKEAADMAKSRGVSANIMAQSEGDTTGQPTVPAQPASENADQKEQGSLQATGQPSAQVVAQINQDADLEELRFKTREGRGHDEKNWAIAQRLTKIDHVGTPTHSTE